MSLAGLCFPGLPHLSESRLVPICGRLEGLDPHLFSLAWMQTTDVSGAHRQCRRVHVVCLSELSSSSFVHSSSFAAALRLLQRGQVSREEVRAHHLVDGGRETVCEQLRSQATRAVRVLKHTMHTCTDTTTARTAQSMSVCEHKGTRTSCRTSACGKNTYTCQCAHCACVC